MEWLRALWTLGAGGLDQRGIANTVFAEVCKTVRLTTGDGLPDDVSAQLACEMRQLHF